MRKILIPTDFSENAMNAIRFALEFFKNEVCDFYIMHAYFDEVYEDDSLLTQKTITEVTKIVSENSEAHLKETIKEIEKNLPNPKHTYNYISSKSTLIDETDDLVNEKEIDIVIMGTRGKTNDRKLTFGTHTLQVLKFAQCPVLVIPNDYKYKEPKHILFPTNYMIPYKKRELDLLCDILEPFSAEIDMVYVSMSNKLSMRQEHNKDFIKEHLCKHKVNFKTVHEKNISEAIFEYIDKNNIDILVMVNTKHYFIENIIFQSVIDQLGLNLKIPLLAMQNMKRC